MHGRFAPQQYLLNGNASEQVLGLCGHQTQLYTRHTLLNQTAGRIRIQG